MLEAVPFLMSYDFITLGGKSGCSSHSVPTYPRTVSERQDQPTSEKHKREVAVRFVSALKL